MKALLLLSGGIDSPIAGYLMQQRGWEIVPLHFSSEPVTDDSSTKKCAALAEKLGFGKLYVVKIGKLLAEIVNQCNHRYYYVLQRRVMLRIAEQVALKEGCSALITGDNLGQVGSQTLSNMANITRAVKMAIHRPLLGLDKQEIIRIAENIGTFELSKGPEICCQLGPKHPVTQSNLEVVGGEERTILSSVEDFIKQIENHLQTVIF